VKHPKKRPQITQHSAAAAKEMATEWSPQISQINTDLKSESAIARSS